MKIMSLRPEQVGYRQEVAELLRQVFPHSYGDSAEAEVESCLEEGRVALIALHEDQVVGFVGAIPQYGSTGWELHPLVVKQSMQSAGIGSMLTAALENEIAQRGGLTVYLGTDDEFGQTSLSGVDLYENLWGQIANIANPGRHPYEFYAKNGYKIVGVIPDANGPGKPDIIMAKRLK